MPLGEQEKGFIAQLEAAGGPAFNEMKVEDARLAILQLFKVENPEQVASVEDKKISTVNGDLPLRIYTPTGDGPHPILMFFHGGGWVVGNIESHDAMCRVLTNAAQCITISVDYLYSIVRQETLFETLTQVYGDQSTCMWMGV